MADAVLSRLLGVLSEHLYYDEIAVPFTRMQNECKQLISSFTDANIDISSQVNCSVFTIDQANELVSKLIKIFAFTLQLKLLWWQSVPQSLQLSFKNNPVGPPK